ATVLQAQPQGLDAGIDDVGPPHQNGSSETFLDDELRRTQHAILFTLGPSNLLLRDLGRCEDRLHARAGPVHEARHGLPVGFEVGQRATRHAALHLGLGYRWRDALDQARIERSGDQVVGAELETLIPIGGGDDIRHLRVRQTGDGTNGGRFHRLVDGRCADIKRAAEQEGKAQDVVDLVWIVRAARRNNGIGAHRFGFFRQDLRGRVGQCQDQRVLRHALDHVRLEHAAGRQPKKDVGPLHDVPQGARGRRPRTAGVDRVHSFWGALEHDTFRIGDENVFHANAEADELVQAGDRRRTGAGAGDLHVADVFADQLEAIEDGRRGDDCGAVLIVVEHRYLHALPQRPLDVEALGSLDVLQIDTAEGRLQAGHDLDQLVWIALVHFDVKHVDAGELLEQAALTFHHRLAGGRPDIAEAEHGRAVGDYRNQVGTRGQRGRFLRVILDGEARIGDAGRIGEREVSLVHQSLGRRDGDFSERGNPMILQ